MMETRDEEGVDESKSERKEVVEDGIDQILSKKDGMIPRERDPQLYVACVQGLLINRYMSRFCHQQQMPTWPSGKVLELLCS